MVYVKIKDVFIRFKSNCNQSKFPTIEYHGIIIEIKNIKEIYALGETLKSECSILMVSIDQFFKELNYIKDVILWLNTIQMKHVVLVVTDMNNSKSSEIEFTFVKNTISTFLKTINYFNLKAIYCIPIESMYKSSIFSLTNKLSWYKGCTLLELTQNIYEISDISENDDYLLARNNFQTREYCIFLKKFLNQPNSENSNIYINNVMKFFNQKEMSTISDLLTVYVIVINDMKGKIKIHSKGYLNSLWENKTMFTIINMGRVYDKFTKESIDGFPKYITNKNSALINIVLEHPICVYLYDNHREASFIRLYDKEHKLYAFGFIKNAQHVSLYEIQQFNTFVTYITFLIYCDRDDILREILTNNTYNQPKRLFLYAVNCNSPKSMKLLLDLGFFDKSIAILYTSRNKKMRRELINSGYSMEIFCKFDNVNRLINEYFDICKAIQHNFLKHSNSLNINMKCALGCDMIRMKRNVGKYQSNQTLNYNLNLVNDELNSIIQDILDPYDENLLLKFCFNQRREKIEDLPLIKVACELDCLELFINSVDLYTHDLTYRYTLIHIIHASTFKSFLEKNCFKILKFLCHKVFYNRQDLLAEEIYEDLDYKLYFHLIKLDFRINSANSILNWLLKTQLSRYWSQKTVNSLSFGLNFIENNSCINYFVTQLFHYCPNQSFELNLISFHMFRLELLSNESNMKKILRASNIDPKIGKIYQRLLKTFKNLKSIDISLDQNRSLKLSDLLLNRNIFYIYRYCNPDIEKFEIETDNLYLKKFLFLQLAKIVCIQFIESLLLRFIPQCCIDQIFKLFSEYDILIIMSQTNEFTSFFDCPQLITNDSKITSFFKQLQLN